MGEAVTVQSASRTQAAWAPRLLRPWAMIERNVAFLLAGSSYGWVLLASAGESLLLLLGFVWGFGGASAQVTVSGTVHVPLGTFVAPALVAVAVLDAAWAENLFTFFGKLDFVRLYRPILYTPMSPMDIAVGELFTGGLRIALQLVLIVPVLWLLGLFGVMTCLGLVAAGLVAGAVFSMIGMVLGTFLRTWEDFDLVSTAQFALTMVSGVFFPVTVLPRWLQVTAWASPLYHAVEIMRAICLPRTAGTAVAWHLAGLLLFGLLSFPLLRWRVERVLPRH